MAIELRHDTRAQGAAVNPKNRSGRMRRPREQEIGSKRFGKIGSTCTVGVLKGEQRYNKVGGMSFKSPGMRFPDW